MGVLKSFFSSSYVNKYTISILVFVLWIGIFDRYSWIKQINVERKIHKLQDKKEEYEDLLQSAIKEHEDIMKHKEKYAREKYFLHKEGEEVFVIE